MKIPSSVWLFQVPLISSTPTVPVKVLPPPEPVTCPPFTWRLVIAYWVPSTVKLPDPALLSSRMCNVALPVPTPELFASTPKKTLDPGPDGVSQLVQAARNDPSVSAATSAGRRWVTAGRTTVAP